MDDEEVKKIYVYGLPRDAALNDIKDVVKKRLKVDVIDFNNDFFDRKIPKAKVTFSKNVSLSNVHKLMSEIYGHSISVMPELIRRIKAEIRKEWMETITDSDLLRFNVSIDQSDGSLIGSSIESITEATNFIEENFIKKWLSKNRPLTGPIQASDEEEEKIETIGGKVNGHENGSLNGKKSPDQEQKINEGGRTAAVNNEMSNGEVDESKQKTNGFDERQDSELRIHENGVWDLYMLQRQEIYKHCQQRVANNPNDNVRIENLMSEWNDEQQMFVLDIKDFDLTLTGDLKFNEVVKSMIDVLQEKNKVVINCVSNGRYRIVGMPDDIYKFEEHIIRECKVFMRKEKDKKSNFDRSSSSHSITSTHSLNLVSYKFEDYQWQFIKIRYPDFHKLFQEYLPRILHNQVEITASPDEINKIKDWVLKHDIDRLERRLEIIPEDVDSETFKVAVDVLQHDLNVVVSFPSAGKADFIGLSTDIRRLTVSLSKAIDDQKKRIEQHQMKTSRTSGSLIGQSRRTLVISASNDELHFTTPLSGIDVKVYKGNLIKERTQAIVSPTNSYLKNAAGAAKAIEDAAGWDLIDDCKKHIRSKKELQTAEVISTRSGRLYPPIKFVIHACGPSGKGMSDQKKCQDLLEKTFINCFLCANELGVDSMSVPAISSGIYGVDKDTVSVCSWSSLMSFDKLMSSASAASKKHALKKICFVNIESQSTQSLIRIFKKRLIEIDFELNSHENLKDMNGSSGALRRSGSLTRLEGKLRKDRLMADASSSSVDEKDKTSRNTLSSNPSEQKSTHVTPQIKNTLKSKDSSTSDVKCCVCFQQKRILRKHRSCSHKCCDLCASKKCNQCTQTPQSFGSESGTKAKDLKSNLENSKPKSESLVDRTDKGEDNEPRRSRRSTSVDLSSLKMESIVKKGSTATIDDDDKCAICMDKIDNPKKLDCGHSFCEDCIKSAFKYQKKCPSCGKIFGTLTGNQPDGTMLITESFSDVSGFRGCGSYVISYDFSSGIQSENHPNPGKRYQGTSRVAYLPRNAEGKEVSELLRKAFDAKLVFTIGKSTTTGRDNVVTWNDIHHKTSMLGQYGYPDPTYFSRVKDELAAKGIISESKQSDKSTNEKRKGSSDPYRIHGFSSLQIYGDQASSSSPSSLSERYRSETDDRTNRGTNKTDLAGIHQYSTPAYSKSSDLQSMKYTSSEFDRSPDTERLDKREELLQGSRVDVSGHRSRVDYPNTYTSGHGSSSMQLSNVNSRFEHSTTASLSSALRSPLSSSTDTNYKLTGATSKYDEQQSSRTGSDRKPYSSLQSSSNRRW